MQVQIENFKGIRSATYVFKNNCTTLITGQSGIGKSSILDAINYAICGDNSRNLVNISSNGKILVKIQLNNICITRTNKPKKITAFINDRLYEGDNAQQMIDEFFTPFFRDISYIRQKGMSTFLQKSSTEKMDFLRTWITNDKSIQITKTNLKDYTKTITKKLDDIRVKLEIEKGVMSRTTVPAVVDNPIPSGENSTEYQKKKNTERKKLTTKLETIINDLKHLDVLIANEHLYIKKKELEQYKSDVDHSSMITAYKQLQCFNMEREKLTRHGDCDESTLDELYKQKDIDAKVSSLDKIVKNLPKYLAQAHSLIQSNEQELTNINTKLDKLKILKTKSKTYLQELDRLSEYNTFFQDEDVKGITLKDGKYYEFNKVFFDTYLCDYVCCPNCSKTLKITDGNERKIFIMDGTSTSTSSSINTQLKDAYVDYMESLDVVNGLLKDHDIQELSCKTYEKQINELTTHKAKLTTDLQQLKERLEQHTFSLELSHCEVHSCNDLCKKLDKIFEAIIERKKYGDYIVTDDIDKRIELKKTFQETQYRREYLDKMIAEIIQKHNLTDLNNINTKLEEIQLLQQKNQEYNALMSMISDDDFEDIHNCKEQYTLLTAKKQKIEKNITEIDMFKNELVKYVEYIKKKKEYNNMQTSIDDYQKKFDKLTLKHTNCNILKMMIEKTEARLIDLFIYELNTNIQKYVDQFFIDEAMTVNIKCVRGANEQPKIAFNMVYKGNAIDDVKILSGGEYDRLQLSITLAFADIIKIPLLMLDETVNSLDEELCTHVLEQLKTTSRITLIIAHQVEEGLFDNAITVV